MKREEVNQWVSAYLSLAPDRELLATEGFYSESLEELLKEWLWAHEVSPERLLEVKIYFGLTYKQLAEVFDTSPGEVAQIIKGQRSARLPTYPPVERSQQASQISGLSCFMVEQYLSSFLDGEIQDEAISRNLVMHTEQCMECRERLNLYRRFHSQILSTRQPHEAFSEDEWNRILADFHRHERRRLRRFILYAFTFTVSFFILAWWFWAQPEETPNIYRIPETESSP